MYLTSSKKLEPLTSREIIKLADNLDSAYEQLSISLVIGHIHNL